MRLVPIFGLALAAAIAGSVLPVSSSYAQTYSGSSAAQNWVAATGLSHVTHPGAKGMRHSGAQRGSVSSGRSSSGHGGLGHGGRGHDGGGGGHGGGGHGR
jgi:hypothetical protein